MTKNAIRDPSQPSKKTHRKWEEKIKYVILPGITKIKRRCTWHFRVPDVRKVLSIEVKEWKEIRSEVYTFAR